MASLLQWLKRTPTAPPRIPTDTVIPLHALDANKILSDVVINVSLHYDCVLDAQKLAGALGTLLERPGWRKLGARLRRNRDGKLEYHVPAAYTAARPSFDFSHTTHAMRLAEHPLGVTLPVANGDVQVSRAVGEYRPLFFAEDSPTRIEDWLYTDRPQMVVHVVSFADATLVSVTWVHTFADAMSMRAVFEAWTAVLEGREGDVPEVFGGGEDPLVPLGTHGGTEEEKFVLEGREVKGWAFVRFVVAMLWEVLVHRREEAHYIVLPASTFSSLRATALSSLSSADPALLTPHASHASTPFLSDGDILCAWWTHLLTTTHPSTPTTRPTHLIQILNNLDMRPLLTRTAPRLLSPAQAYVGNCITTVQTIITLRDMLALPLGHLAARIRADLVAQSTRPQVEARWRAQRAQPGGVSGYPPLYGGGDMALNFFSNWGKARMFSVDFSHAVVGGGGEAGVVARPVCVLPQSSVRGLPMRGGGNLAGRDEAGNWWVGGILTPEHWGNVRRVVEGMK